MYFNKERRKLSRQQEDELYYEGYNPDSRVEMTERVITHEQKMRWRANDTRRVRHGKMLGGNHGYREIIPLDSPRVAKIKPVAVFVDGRRFNL
jgi:hypothetical protein